MEEGPKVDTNTHGNLACIKGGIADHWRKERLFNIWGGVIGEPPGKY